MFKVQNNAFSVLVYHYRDFIRLGILQVSYSVHVILYSKKHIKSFDPHICYVVIFVMETIGILLYITTIYSLLMLFIYFVIITDVAKL